MFIHPNHDKDLYNAAKAAQAPKAILVAILAAPAGQPLDGTVSLPPARRLRQPRRTARVYRDRDLPPVSGASGRPAQARPVAGDAGKLRADNVTRPRGHRNDTLTVTVRKIETTAPDASRVASVKRAEVLARTGRPGTLADTARKASEIYAGTRGWTASVDLDPREISTHADGPRTHADLVAVGARDACHVSLTRGVPMCATCAPLPH